MYEAEFRLAGIRSTLMPMTGRGGWCGMSFPPWSVCDRFTSRQRASCSPAENLGSKNIQKRIWEVQEGFRKWERGKEPLITRIARIGQNGSLLISEQLEFGVWSYPYHQCNQWFVFFLPNRFSTETIPSTAGTAPP